MDKSTIANIIIILAVVATGGMVMSGKSGEPIDQLAMTIDESTTYVTVYDGDTPIKDVFETSGNLVEGQDPVELTSYDKAVALVEITDGMLVAEKYPYDVVNGKTTIVIEKYRCTKDICGYWITATRDGQEVATNSPIWISPPPYQAFVSETYNKDLNEVTTMIREDPKLAIEQTLQAYVDRQPVGKAVVGTKE